MFIQASEIYVLYIFPEMTSYYVLMYTLFDLHILFQIFPVIMLLYVTNIIHSVSQIFPLLLCNVCYEVKSILVCT